ncbi:MAG: metal ABC transporter ATP-binding protein [Deltaproteobacteria bacterium]|nr:metal ABC transporter ATP-binding protein [Deltaproteobacteria bacterium]MDH4122053.1 metal ABC transporter ATP-binding protein [Deltaproteobacteria bacterium]
MSPTVTPVDIRDLTVTLGGLAVLDNVSLTIAQGEFLALLGPNGAGKSTLLKVIGGLLTPDSGSVRVFGREPGRPGTNPVGYMPQAGAINPRFPISARGVVMMGRYPALGPGRYPRSADRAAVAQALSAVGAENLATKPLAKLSGGQRQRVFLARALVNNPDLLLLDEPTAGMDTQAVEQFYSLIRGLRDQGKAVVVVSHDIGVVAPQVDRVACLNRRLVAHGLPGQVLDQHVLESMYGCDAMLFTHGDHPHMVVNRHK